MRVNIFRRTEQGGEYSYMAVPEGRSIPAEATNIDWEAESWGIDLNEETDYLEEFSIAQPMQQIQSKGYAITSYQGNASRRM